MLCDLPQTVLDKIAKYSSRSDSIKLAQLCWELNTTICVQLYRTIMVVDNDYKADESATYPYTILKVADVPRFTRCLDFRTFQFVEGIIINTHSASIPGELTGLYQKLSDFWNYTDHVISFINYDVLSLRTTESLNNYLELNSIQFTENDDGDYIVAKKSRKVCNLRDWFMLDILDFLVAPWNSDLKRLSFYIESNRYQANADEGFTIHKPDHNSVRRNLSSLSELFLHSALAFVKYLSLAKELTIPRLQLRRLSLASTHRLRNDARLDFEQINRLFNINDLEELELKINCARQHDCLDLCMVKFFEDWKTYNATHGVETKIRKFSLVHYKSLTETTQFKTIVEQFVFGSLFANVREIYINLSNTVRSPRSHLSINLEKVIAQFCMVPDLEVLHISSFMCEWTWGNLFHNEGDRMFSYHDILTNRCECEECDVTRASFTELAALDRAKNYSHKVKWSDVDCLLPLPGSMIDYTRVENVKFLQYITGLMRQEEIVMERNLTSSGTMLDMRYMPFFNNPELDPFRKLIEHSCLRETQQLMLSHLSRLKTINFGGIILRS